MARHLDPTTVQMHVGDVDATRREQRPLKGEDHRIGKVWCGETRLDCLQRGLSRHRSPRPWAAGVPQERHTR
jgi:hypothetical protein